ncbi:hypothetical protein Q7P37_001685 [Cladosporium fusiforme]
MSSEDSQRGVWNCTFEACSIQQSIFQYQPSLPANAFFIAIFGVSLFVHIYQAYRWKQWTFGILCALGCVSEMIGYGGRIIMHDNPWSFTGFMMQIVCIAFAPVYMTAAIYITLYKSVMRLSPASALFKPALYYQIFIPCDVLCLVIQAAGGALSTQSNGSSQAGVDAALAGLSLQVVVIFLFMALSVQYAFSYRRDVKAGKVSGAGLDARFKLFVVCLSLAILVIFIRCAFRIYELSEGYTGSAFHDEGMFIGLESIMIVLATMFLNIGHPGLVFGPHHAATKSSPDGEYASSEEVKQGAVA